MKQSIDILLFVEHVARELDIACAIKHLVERRHGLSLEVASLTWNLSRTLRTFEPRVVATPYCYSAADLGMHQILPVWPNARYVNLAYEQVFQQINKAHKAPRDRFAHQHVLHHAWGDFLVEFFLAAGVKPGNVFVNGNPSYALYLPPYSNYFASRAELAARHGLDPARRWLFIPENYGVAFLTDRQIQGRYAGFGEQQAYEYRRFAADSFNEAARWWTQAAGLDGIEVIVRPRPATPAEVLTAALVAAAGAPPPHLHVIKDQTVREWILAGDLVASSYSTTLIEASIASKPIRMFTPLPIPDYVQATWYPLVKRAASAHEFLAFARDGAGDGSHGPLNQWATRNMMDHGDAIGNLAAMLADAAAGRRDMPPAPGPGCLPLTRKKESLYRRARGMASRLYHGLRGKPPKTWEKDEIRQDDLQSRLDRWVRVLG